MKLHCTIASCLIAFSLAQPSVIYTIVGTGDAGYSGDNGSGTKATLDNPRAVAVDVAGNAYIADTSNQCVRMWTKSSSVITTIAGGGNGSIGDGGPGTSATLDMPQGVAVDASGNVYISDTYADLVRMRNRSTGIVKSLVGNGVAGFSGDGGMGTNTPLHFPVGIAVDGVGNVYIADSGNSRVRLLSASAGVVTTIAGNGIYGYNGDGGLGTNTMLNYPSGVAVDMSGNVYIADSSNSRMRLWNQSTGIVTTIVGNGTRGFSGDGGAGANAMLANPWGVAVDASGSVFIADTGNSRVRMWTKSTGIIVTIVGNGVQGFAGDGGPGTSAELFAPFSIAVTATGSIYIADSGNWFNNRVRLFEWISASPTASLSPTPTVLPSAPTRVIAVIAGNGNSGFSGDGDVGTSAELSYPSDVATDSMGNVYIADSGNHRVRLWAKATAIITTVAGNGDGGFSGDGGAGTSARLNSPQGIAVDSAGNLYIADTHNFRVRLLAMSTGIITTIAGNGAFGFSGDGNMGTSAQLTSPSGVAVDLAGNVYIADRGNNRVRLWTRSTGIITTIVGNGTIGVYGFSGDGSSGTSAELMSPSGVSVDLGGNVYIADTGNDRVRIWTRSTGIITTIVGSGTHGFNGDGGTGISTALSYPYGVAVDIAGNAYIADSTSSRVRLWTKRTGLITTIAGNGTFGFSGEGGVSTGAALDQPVGITVDFAGYVYFADINNNVVRVLMLSSGTPSSSPTSISSSSHTATSSVTGVPSFSSLPSLTQTPSASYSRSLSQSDSRTDTPSVTTTAVQSSSRTATLTGSASSTRSLSASMTGTPSASHTHSPSSTQVSTPSTTRTATLSASLTASLSGTVSSTTQQSSTPTDTLTPSPFPSVNFIYSGLYQYFVVPPGMMSLRVYVWGGGGGGGGVVALGGAGAFVSGDLAVIPTETLRVIVGRGGPWIGTRGSDEQGSGGGGWAPTLSHPYYYAGAGGGRSAIQRLFGNTYVDIVTAGGGGGGGGYNASGGAAGYVQGHRGGDQALKTAYAMSPVARSLGLTSTWGGGGSPTAGGLGDYIGSSGASLRGGDASKCLRNQCGGGGAGWYGGAAGNDVTALVR